MPNEIRVENERVSGWRRKPRKQRWAGREDGEDEECTRGWWRREGGAVCMGLENAAAMQRLPRRSEGATLAWFHAGS